MPRPRLEKNVESDTRKALNKLRVLFWKFTSPGTPSVPDRIVIPKALPSFMVELKRPGAKPTAKQERRNAQLKKQGYPASWSDSPEKIEEMVQYWDQVCGECGVTLAYSMAVELFNKKFPMPSELNTEVK